MLNKLINYYRKEQFIPSLLGIFINKRYIIRSRLLRGILKYRDALQGCILDFGCGSKPYQDLFQYRKYIGLDIKESGHTREKKKADVYYDGERIPFTNEYFDSIICSEVLEHVFNIDTVLQEFHRVLKKEGACLITIPFAWREHEAPYDFARYTSYGIKSILEKNGFTVISMDKSSYALETMTQLFVVYLAQHVRAGNKLLMLFLHVFVYAPFTIIGLGLSKIFPKDTDLYLNNIILIKKS